MPSTRPASRVARALAAAVCVVAALTAADGAPAGQAGGPAKYVALGDSFAAGPGIPEPVGGPCLRSTTNYANLVATALHVTLTDATCSGATTANVLTTEQGPNPPQLSAVTRDTRYVTVTVGNNDIAYTRSAIDCGASGAAGTSCLGGGVDTTAIATGMQHLEANLVATLRAVVRAAPRARVLLVAYPRVLPVGAAPCPPQNPMLPADSAYVADLGTQLQRHLVAAAKTAKVTFVDAYAPTGHDVCSPEGHRWIEGATPESPALLWHPNERGMRAQAVMIVRAFTRRPARR
jgi:lysophospholipase L1-like esterase